MVPREMLWFLCLLPLVVSDTPPGLVSKDSDQDLLAEPSNTAPVAQKREAALSNSYGEPLPADAYGPPQNIPVIVQDNQPAPIYGVPDFQLNLQSFQTPPGAYGPPAPINVQTVSYDGPPPPVKPSFGYPKANYAPKPIYGPPKKNYGPPKQNLPKFTYGVPFKKISFPKQNYGAPKPVYGPPKYNPPKPIYGPPQPNIQNLPLPELPSLPNIQLPQLPAPIYGTPFTDLPVDLKPNFPIPADNYGPPGQVLSGPIGPEIIDDNHLSHHGPPQPDPNPRPPHPGIPAPPTPPHVLYDGWKPIPGVSKPLQQNVQDEYGPPPPVSFEIHQQHSQQQYEVHQQNEHQHGQNSYHQGQNLQQHGQNSYQHGQNSHQHGQNSQQQFGPQVSSGYANVHQDALQNLDLSSIIGGDSNHIDQSKTVFEAHYTEGGNDFQVQSHRQNGAKGLVPPSGVYGVPPGSQYGAPPVFQPNLPIPYGSVSGGGHTGGNTPKHPIKFRDSVPDGLIQEIAHGTHFKDTHGIDNLKQGPAYLPPPVRDVKDTHHQTGNHGVSMSIEPTSLYSLPHTGNPINFLSLQMPKNLYGSPVDSYSAPLLTVADHSTSGSSNNIVTATVDGNIIANLSNLDAAAILKHCPYHEAILKAAQSGEKIPSDIASSYVASLSSLGNALAKNTQTLFSPNNDFNTPEPGSQSVTYNSKDLSSASNSLVQTILPKNGIKEEKYKGKSLKDGKHHAFKSNDISDQIAKTSEKIKHLSEEAKILQQKIVKTSQNIHQVSGQLNKEIPVRGKLGTYSLQIQAADGPKPGTGSDPTIPHEQLLSEGLLQSILQAIEQPSQKPTRTRVQNQNIYFQQSKVVDFSKIDDGGLVLPEGYEPIDRTKEKKEELISDQEIQGSHQNIQHILNSEFESHRGDVPDCDQRPDNSITHTIVVPAPTQSVDDVKPVEEPNDNDVAIFFGEKQSNDDSESNETVTEISVATSISEEEYPAKKDGDFGEKIEKKST